MTGEACAWAGEVAEGLKAAWVSPTEVFCCPRGCSTTHLSQRQIPVSRFRSNHTAKGSSCVDDALVLTQSSAPLYIVGRAVPGLLIQAGCRTEEPRFWCSQESCSSLEWS